MVAYTTIKTQSIKDLYNKTEMLNNSFNDSKPDINVDAAMSLLNSYQIYNQIFNGDYGNEQWLDKKSIM